MTFGIADSSIIPMRREKSGRSEMVSQLLFGEVYEVLEFEDKWLNIRLLHDGSCGWIDRKSYKEVGTEFVERYRASDQLIMSEVFNLVVKKGDWENKMIVAGSVLPFYDAYAKKLMIGEEEYVVRGFLREVGIESLRELLIQYALMFYMHLTVGEDERRMGWIVPLWYKWYIVWREWHYRGTSSNRLPRDKLYPFWKRLNPETWLSSGIIREQSRTWESCGSRDVLFMLRGKYGWIK